MEIDGEDFASLADFVSLEIFEFLSSVGEQQGDAGVPTTPSAPGLVLSGAGEQQGDDAGVPTTSSAPGLVEGEPNSSSNTGICEQTDEIQRLLQKNTNANTAKSTKYWVSKFSKWAIEHQVHPELAEIPESELDGILQRFFAQIRKNDSENYEPESLKVMQASLDRHLRESGHTYSILKDSNFSTSRKVLNGKAIDLQEQGMGKRKRKADSLTHEEEERIWSSGVLNGDNPTSLNYLIFFQVSLHMGTRGRQEHHQIRIEDLKIVKNCDGEVTHIEWVEGPTKTRQGGLKKTPRSVSQKIFKIGGPRCPVAAILKLLSKRPESMTMSGPLYLAPLRKERDWSKTEVWFVRGALGVNTINRFMEVIATKAGLDVTSKRFTNHSLRKTTVTKLRKSGATNREIMAITGHKNELSLAAYDTLDLDDHRHLGQVIGGATHSDNVELESSSTEPNNQLCTLMSQSSSLSHPFSSHSSQPIVFQNCTFNNCFASCSSSSYTQQACSSSSYTQQSCSHNKPKPSRKRTAYILSSDSDSD